MQANTLMVPAPSIVQEAEVAEAKFKILSFVQAVAMLSEPLGMAH